MPYELKNRLVIGLASSALFDLEESDEVFRLEGEEAYRNYQRKNQNRPLPCGVAFSFVRRLLSLNQLNPTDPPVEVILLSRNDPDTGLRVMKSIEFHDLPMTRAVFLQGQSPQAYIPALNISLFLSANELDVKQAMTAGYPAGQVLKTLAYDDPEDHQLRIALDFDGVLADDEAESIYQQSKDLTDFHDHERSLVDTPHNPGPLAEFLKKISIIQKLEQTKIGTNPSYIKILDISIVTARNAPSHERVINTMRHWEIMVNKAFFLGGIEKKSVLEVLKPHIFFDDQRLHLDPAASVLPSVHIPFGAINKLN
ncbi:MAG: 5'-nucleotidase [Gammaproteobacteria bacterium]|jgi:5'-nucleotidase|uniref:5'-nucleotidase n=1 Tax=Stutzerimonas xanthomarina TaxID=271420 RepID=UPI000E88EF5F|nr:5'-nucleotidase [Stutzerimonas xanthomarina]MBU0852858.1 5'-nucleotidase [Gammaproteobacteria bacterium]HAW23172.1 5'-nucleotidase [Pseudomonas sp.]MBK3848298.1 5'-nucleotidase [Stutzerimonas xanthomarina]MBU1458214.1 5'-nucleotidase [Gammaproteobacteria bacterium]MBU2281725.1 5'-nucleotidase [Gammaproteobacteria bacterium]|tara:strand:+ start:3390 stop:4322 length:933 start_codon:yes stop_codon:yes gene_type:complete